MAIEIIIAMEYKTGQEKSLTRALFVAIQGITEFFTEPRGVLSGSFPATRSPNLLQKPVPRAVPGRSKGVYVAVTVSVFQSTPRKPQLRQTYSPLVNLFRVFCCGANQKLSWGRGGYGLCPFNSRAYRSLDSEVGLGWKISPGACCFCYFVVPQKRVFFPSLRCAVVRPAVYGAYSFRVRVRAFKYPILELFCAARSATASRSKRSGRLLLLGDSCLYEGLRKSQPGGRGDRGTKQCTTVQLACGQFFPAGMNWNLGHKSHTELVSSYSLHVHNHSIAAHTCHP